MRRAIAAAVALCTWSSGGALAQTLDKSVQFYDAAGQLNALGVTEEVTLVGVWATWCGACRQELPQLVELASLDGVGLVLVSVDQSPKRAVRFLASRGWEAVPQAFDPGAKIATTLGIEAIPTVVVLGSDGRETARVTGADPAAAAALRDAAARAVQGDRHVGS